MIFRVWLLLRPVVEHLVARRIVLIKGRRPLLLEYPYSGRVKRDFADALLVAFIASRESLKVVAADVSRDYYGFYDAPPVPVSWRADE